MTSSQLNYLQLAPRRLEWRHWERVKTPTLGFNWFKVRFNQWCSEMQPSNSRLLNSFLGDTITAARVTTLYGHWAVTWRLTWTSFSRARTRISNMEYRVSNIDRWCVDPMLYTPIKTDQILDSDASKTS